MEVSKHPPQHVDVLIVGAGISGIDAAYRLKTRCSTKSWLILEARDRIGGTWDLFRYPGVRSDSDIFTLGFPFRPWPTDQAIVGGPDIRQYVEDTAREFGIFEKIRFGHRITRATWSSNEARWTVETKRGRFTCSFLYLATGYYDYDRGHCPSWPGEEEFQGRIVHPQFWPEDMDYAGKRVAVIGSGATAVTLVPALASQAAHVTMVQRSPSYVVSRPSRDRVAGWLQRHLPARAAHAVIRWKNLLLGIYFFGRARREPERVSRRIREEIGKALPVGYPVERDFTPSYKPWDQRLCLIPDRDLFNAISSGKVSIATGTIDRFTPEGLRLEGGATVPADIIVAATGLKVQFLGSIKVDIDGEPVSPSDRFIYKGLMLSGIPNLFLVFGYTNASWTLRSDLTGRSVCRLLNRMDRDGLGICVARAEAGLYRRPAMELSSGYVRRAEAVLPAQGDRHPWRVRQNYVRDLAAMTLRPIDEALDFRARSQP